MAKASGLPSVDVENVQKVAEKPVEKAPEPTIEDVQPVKTTLIEAPLGPITEGGYVSRRERVEFSSMSRRQSLGLHRLTRGLQDSGATLENGTKIKRSGQAVRWLLEQLG